MSIWYVTPSARPYEEAKPVVDKWRDSGYKVALLRQGAGIHCDLLIATNRYLGLPYSVNLLVSIILATDPDAEWFIHGGDDYLPDPKLQPTTIAKSCEEHFCSTFGVMQPTGDRYGDGYIDTAAASAWMGREWCQKMYLGRGPMCNDYTHYYADRELQEVSTLFSVFWQRPDIYQEHRHWTRFSQIVPAHLAAVHERMQDDARIFDSRKAAGFPKSGPLAVLL